MMSKPSVSALAGQGHRGRSMCHRRSRRCRGAAVPRTAPRSNSNKNSGRVYVVSLSAASCGGMGTRACVHYSILGLVTESLGSVMCHPMCYVRIRIAHKTSLRADALWRTLLNGWVEGGGCPTFRGGRRGPHPPTFLIDSHQY
eukprot:scaffold13167_cov123-Isochrysis_galbana.AAC.3